MTSGSCRCNQAELERRLSELEAREQINALISRYGPLVDSGQASATAGLWTEEGTYAFSLDGELHALRGREEICGMVLGDMHQGIIRRGSGHVMTPPVVHVDGDRAVATGYTMLVRHDSASAFYIDRLSANRWELARHDGVWRVEKRINQLLDGRQDARALLEQCDQIEPLEETDPDGVLGDVGDGGGASNC